MIKKIFFQLVFFNFLFIGKVFTAESGGMPQLNPEFWISQIFWLTITFGILYVVLSKLILPKISANLELRKSQISDNIEAADRQREDSETKLKEYDEVISKSKTEAKNIFSMLYKDISILIHPSSYVHAIVKFNNGMTKIIVHDTTMKVPIFNTIYSKSEKKLKSKELNLDKLNNLNFTKVDLKKFPLVKILKILPKKCSLFETVLVATNDELVNLYLKNKIKYTDISQNFFKIINLNEFKKYKKIKIKKVESVLELNEYVRFKINSISI